MHLVVIIIIFYRVHKPLRYKVFSLYLVLPDMVEVIFIFILLYRAVNSKQGTMYLHYTKLHDADVS